MTPIRTEPDRLRPDPAAIALLRDADPVLAGVIDRVGAYDRPLERRLWPALVGSIISQQLSTRAAATIERRVACLAESDHDDFPAPETVLACPVERLRACGLSGAKVGYIRGVAHAFVSGRLDPTDLAALPDDAVIEALTALRGVGRWTAEMVLIFSFGRPDVLPVDDLGFRVAAQRAYGLAKRPGGARLREIGEGWIPHRTTATLFLWESLEG